MSDDEKKVIIGSDHGGYDLKMVLVEFLQEQGWDVTDVGTDNGERCDYPDIAQKVGLEVVAGSFPCGILLCGTGIGISIAANKIQGIRCALAHDHYSASLCRKHNDANILALGGRTTGPEVAKEIVMTYLETEFEGGRHAKRLAKMTSIEEGSIGIISQDYLSMLDEDSLYGVTDIMSKVKDIRVSSEDGDEQIEKVVFE
eukprot:TRINITY_DN7659_c0_g1_i1.p1 TRINITY_DN7659_c0_g1~~TRINITY_DN7659_c0_g1_i1.p1  ORF type:complete len:200 (+),score=46.30 TRINITY_DN7659_c0_g1_i1:20-619(+)